MNRKTGLVVLAAVLVASVTAYLADMYLGDPPDFGHSAGEVEVDWSGEKINLQVALDRLGTSKYPAGHYCIVQPWVGSTGTNYLSCPEGFTRKGGWDYTRWYPANRRTGTVRTNRYEKCKTWLAPDICTLVLCCK
jgi:hypothetical protein